MSFHARRSLYQDYRLGNPVVSMGILEQAQQVSICWIRESTCKGANGADSSRAGWSPNSNSAQRSQLSGCITGLTLISVGFMGALFDATVNGSDAALVKTVFEAYSY